MLTICNVVKTSDPILIFGRTGDIRRDIARQIANRSLYKKFGETYFDCGVEYGSVPLTAGTIIIDNVDYASKSVQVRLKDCMDAKVNDEYMRFIFCSETNLVGKVNTGKLLPGVFHNIVMSINAEHVLL
jgi:hypothetical protein